MKTSKLVTSFLAVLVCCALTAPAAFAAPKAKHATVAPKTSSAKSSSKWGTISAGPGLGYTVNPAHFDFVVGGEYFYESNISLGMDFHFIPYTGGMGFDLMPQGRYYVPVPGLPNFDAFVGAGVGAIVDTSGGADLDIMVPSFGFDYALSDNLTIGSDFGLHILTDFNQTNPLFHLILARIKYKF